MLNTDENAKDCREILQAVYANIFVEYVAKNPLYTPGQPFKCAPCHQFRALGFRV